MEPILEKILDLIYPPCCMFCGKIINYFHYQLTCPECYVILPVIKEEKCHKCGKELAKGYINKICPDCLKVNHYFDQGYSCFVYNEKIKRAVYHFKFKKKKRYGKYLGRYLATSFSEEIIKNRYDYIIPVPLSKEKYKTRKFNQAEELAKCIQEKCNIAMDSTILYRRKDTKAQSTLGAKERKNNIQDAFGIKEKINIQGNKILLVDDIYTTGSTADMCTFLLKSHGATKVDILTLATGMNTK